MMLDEFFDGYEESRPLFDALNEVIDSIGLSVLRVSKSQIAYRRRRAFAWVWIPGRYLRGRVSPLVLSLALRRRDRSPRWKEIVELVPGRFMHHLELNSMADIDRAVCQWVREAWEDGT